MKISCCNRLFSEGFVYCNSIIFHRIGIVKPKFSIILEYFRSGFCELCPTFRRVNAK
nr:MAG TPA: DBF DBF zinc finger [Caudoviricetes sp.]